MSTRSNVAVEDPNTKEIKVIYVHSDGYPDGVGDVLLKHYNDYDSANMLVNKGSASYIAHCCWFYFIKMVHRIQDFDAHENDTFSYIVYIQGFWY